MSENELITNLAKEVVKRKTSGNTDTKIYGTIEEVNGKKYIHIDGSIGLTPVAEANEAIVGDRVIATIKDRNVIVTGNITSPASARTATNYMKLDPEKGGLVVGDLKDGDPSGGYTLMTGHSYEIYDDSGKKVGSFSTNDVILGDDILKIKREEEVTENGTRNVGSIETNNSAISFYKEDNADGNSYDVVQLTAGSDLSPDDYGMLLLTRNGLSYKYPGMYTPEETPVLTGNNLIEFRTITTERGSGQVQYYNIRFVFNAPYIQGYVPIALTCVGAQGMYMSSGDIGLTFYRLDGRVITVIFVRNKGSEVSMETIKSDLFVTANIAYIRTGFLGSVG